MWTLPGALLWIPTVVNAAISMEIGHLSWERWRGAGNTAQGELEPFMHILALSAPIAVVISIGWAALSVMRTRVPRDQDSPRHDGVTALALLNVLAPILLWCGLKWLA